jgi:hypothetical protein
MTLGAAPSLLRTPSMKLKVPPVVLAAALGLLGPAALDDTDERSERGVDGLWKRATGAPDSARAGALGDRIEVVRIEDKVLLDDGSGRLDDQAGSWTVGPDILVQSLDVAGAQVVREFALDGDQLTVEVRVERDGHLAERWSTSYERVTDVA